MTPQFAKSSSIHNPNRCHYRFPNGMRCRLIGFGNQPFCPKHTQVATPPQPNPAEIAASLTADLKEFRSALPINDFLARLLLLLAENKISPRRAAVLAYITNQLLRTLPAIDRELNPKEDPNAPVEIIFDMPGPDREQPQQPQPTYADVRI